MATQNSGAALNEFRAMTARDSFTSPWNYRSSNHPMELSKTDKSGATAKDGGKAGHSGAGCGRFLTPEKLAGYRTQIECARHFNRAIMLAGVDDLAEMLDEIEQHRLTGDVIGRCVGCGGPIYTKQPHACIEDGVDYGKKP
jgi:hypothetical protein